VSDDGHDFREHPRSSYLAGLSFSVIDTPAVARTQLQFGQRLASLKELEFADGALLAELKVSSCEHVTQLAGVYWVLRHSYVSAGPR
jgi:hypothetical protein